MAHFFFQVQIRAQISISSIRTEDIGTVIEVKGQIIKAHGKIFKLQETDIIGKLPQTLTCSIDNDDSIKLKLAYVKGVLETKDDASKSFKTFELRHCSIRYIETKTWFTEENLKDIEQPTALLLIQFLNSYAYHEGFKLTRKKSLNSTQITLRCNFHDKYGKNPNLNSKCDFFISISLSQNLWHVTKSYLHHTHFTDNFSLMHLTLNDEIKQLIKNMYSTNVSLSQICYIIKKQYNIEIAPKQVKNICNCKQTQEKILETDLLKNYLEENNGKCFFLEREDETHVIHRRACASFSLQELENLKNYGDMIATMLCLTMLKQNRNIMFR